MALNVRIPTYIIWGYKNFEITAMIYPVFWFTHIPIVFDLFLYLFIYVYLSRYIYGAHIYMHIHMASLMVQTVMNLPAMPEIQFWSMGQEDPLEKETATHFSILAWRIPWREEPGGLLAMESQKLDMTERLTLSLLYIYFRIWSSVNSPLKAIPRCLWVI